MLGCKAASDAGWKTAAKRADAMEKLESRPDRRVGFTSLSPFSISYGSGFLRVKGNNRRQKGDFLLVKEKRHLQRISELNELFDLQIEGTNLLLRHFSDLPARRLARIT